MCHVIYAKWYHIASRNDDRFTGDFLRSLIREFNLPRALETLLPKGVFAQSRVQDGKTFLFLLNFNGVPSQLNGKPAQIDLGSKNYTDAETHAPVQGILTLDPYGSRVLVEA